MKQFEDLKTAAEKVGYMDLFKGAEDRIRNLEHREQTGVFIAGGANSGKTTILNGIVGTTLREPSFLTEEEKPLRVVFEKQDDDEAFECHVAANRFWNDEDAILYEVKNTDIFRENNEPEQLLDFADVVFYVVSAMMPFTSEDMEMIKALSFLHVKVVLNKMDQIDKDAQKKVAEYVTGICTTLGVGKPIIIQMSEWEKIAKDFRAALPLYDDRKLLRDNHERMIRREAVSGLLEKAEKRLDDVRIQYEKDREKQLEIQEKQALWGKLRTRMLEQGNDLSIEVSRNVKGMTAELTEKLQKMDIKKAAEPERYLQKQMEKEMKEMAMSQSGYVEKRMKEDSKSMMESAVNLGLVEGFDINDAKFMELTSIRIETMTSVMDGKAKGAGVNNKGNQIIAGTAVAIGLFVVLPLPTAVSWIGGITAAGIGGSTYVKNTKETQEKERHDLIAEYCEVNLNHLASTLADAVKKYYGRLAETIKERAAAISAPAADDEGFRILESELKEITEKCRNMLDNQ